MSNSVIFCRVSSREQQETGYSLPAQEKYLKEYAEKNDFNVTKVFAVSESASGRYQRKIFNQMIDYIKKNKITVVVVETTDRLTRNFADVPVIDKWVLENDENQIHLAKEGCVLNRNSKSHEWFMWRVKVATAEYYVRLLSENVKKGQKEKISEGWLPGKPPMGYKTVGEKGHKIHVINDEKVAYAKKMFELYKTGEWSVERITEHLYEDGLRSDTGRKIPTSRIHEYLNEPFYCGKVRWNNKITQGKHVPIIDEETFNKVQQLLRGKGTPKYNTHSFRFKGLLRCKGCSGIITWESQKSIIYGHCNHYRNCVQEQWSRQEEVEGQIVSEFGNIELNDHELAAWLKKALKDSHKDEMEYYNTSVDDLNSRHIQIQQRLDRLYDDKLDGAIDKDMYDRKFKQYTEEKEEVLAKIKKHSNANVKYFQLGSSIFELSQRAREIYLKSTNEDDKRSLISLVFEKMTLDEGKVDFEFTPTFKMLAEAIKATNRSKTAKVTNMKTEIFEPILKSQVEPVNKRKEALLGAPIRYGSGGRIRTDDQTLNRRPLCH